VKIFYVNRKGFLQGFSVVLLVIILLFLLNISPFRVAENVMEAVNKENPIYFVYTEEEKMALSFDAAWGAEHTEEILSILGENNVRATFFLTDIWLDAYPEMAKRIAEQGHEIGMHSVTHPHFNELSKEDMVREVEGNYQTILQITGYQAELFRFPFGEYNNTAIELLREKSIYPIQWSIDSLDWQESATKESICQRIEERMHNGAIVLFHNNGTFTAEALKEILRIGVEKGYEFVPIGELIYKNENYQVDMQGGQSE